MLQEEKEAAAGQRRCQACANNGWRHDTQVGRAKPGGKTENRDKEQIVFSRWPAWEAVAGHLFWQAVTIQLVSAFKRCRAGHALRLCSAGVLPASEAAATSRASCA
ncbi:MAG: hypothetical protein COX17_04430 [Deltaproteobacteria bacterium CG23_combo_of_CG06-09_8_20_14_all_60_8]|nr:MAG: hypothetical protein AUK28_05665 [Desulfobacterales bacterium CG2_30_60_27]PIP43907.1 MAG: hypothetical protein COX17_04430 [Deltaproteobacteria bacterium CG23_combo_of_CG06-09_8_20_14_all_60_8]